MRALYVVLSVLLALAFAGFVAASTWAWAYGSNDAASLTLALASILPLWGACASADLAREA